MKPYIRSALLFCAIVYFGVHGLTGERGVLSTADREAKMEQRKAELAHLLEERQDLEVRVRYLRSSSLSRDLLEERARAVIGFVDPRDYVVRVNTPLKDNQSETLAG
ncbi:septum formation initiator family protein [Brevundimonas sp.]|uniref:FtsB family cell division protein n=1 Tax=Brevundimonas sp. TaxID=1871086 RepID=UPI002899935A|nr:septum formation initiator family protein [Brevundimonas sp.]